MPIKSTSKIIKIFGTENRSVRFAQSITKLIQVLIVSLFTKLHKQYLSVDYHSWFAMASKLYYTDNNTYKVSQHDADYIMWYELLSSYIL